MLQGNALGFRERPVTVREEVVGSLPFALFGLFGIALELPIGRELGGQPPAWWSAVAGGLLVAILVLPAVGVVAGWVQGFPRWSYPYVAMAFLMARYIQGASTPGLQIVGYPIFGRELWGWRAWILLALALVLAPVLARSFRPLAMFFTNLWEDWSILSYLMIGLLPLLVLMEFDEMDRLYSLYFMVPFALLLVATVGVYLRGPQTRQRVLALTVGVVALVLATGIGTTAYWLRHSGMSSAHAQAMLLRAVIIILIVLLPAWLELLRHSVARLRTA